MSWNVFIVNVVYEDNSPVENAKVVYNFNQQTQYYTGYTGADGLLKIIAEGAQTAYTASTIFAFDLDLYLESRENHITIQDGYTYTFTLDSSDVGLTYQASVALIDYLYYAITTTNYPIIYQYNLYYKDNQDNYVFQTAGTLNHETLDFFNYRLPTTSIKVELINDEYSDSPYVRYFDYADKPGGVHVIWRVMKTIYKINFIDINDTINWGEFGRSLIGCNVTFFGYDTNDNLNFSSSTISSQPTLIDIDILNFYSVYPTDINTMYNLKKSGKNLFKITKNHYNDYTANCFVSANTDMEFFLIESGKTINDPVILEREPNVCMTNEDLFDYIISLTGIRPNMPNFYDYETDADLMKKVGVSKLPFYNDWISAITQYLPQQYQGQTASTLNDFKMLFVSAISTDYVQTMYTSSPQVESQYGANSNHGYVWDRCFIPISAETFDNCLTFVPLLTKNVNELPKISLHKVGSPTDVQIEYRIGENGSWNSCAFNTDITFDDRISFRRTPSNTGITFSTANGYYNFQLKNNTYNIVLSGSVTSLLDGKGKNDTALSDYCFRRLFEGCGISQASSLELPSNNLTLRCYESMFSDCNVLATAPNLPATTLGSYCYSNMFYKCLSLDDAPALSVTNLADSPGCYSQMFAFCTSLTSAPNLPATALSSYCYFSMFASCTSLTTVQQTLPSLTLASCCYQQMFMGCTSLTTPPSLPATNLTGADYCYSTMFGGCTSLTAVPNLPATVLAPYCYSQMFSLCEHITSMPSLAANQLTEGCYQRMFINCYLITGVTNLQALTLAENCYESMFENCTSLQTPPKFNSAAGLKSESCKKMFKGCTSLETIPTNSVQSWQALGVSCFEEMFRGCTSLELLPTLLPAQTAKDYCYKGMFAYCTSLNVRSNGFTIFASNLQNTSGVCESMFEGCTSMTSGITANSVKLGPDSYKRMFYGCCNMSYIKQNFSATTSGVFNSNNASAFTENWVSGVSSTGGFITVNQTWFNSYAFYGPNGIPNNTGWRVGIQ